MAGSKIPPKNCSNWLDSPQIRSIFFGFTYFFVGYDAFRHASPQTSFVDVPFQSFGYNSKEVNYTWMRVPILKQGIMLDNYNIRIRPYSFHYKVKLLEHWDICRWSDNQLQFMPFHHGIYQQE